MQPVFFAEKDKKCLLWNKEFRQRNSRAAARLPQQPNFLWRGMCILPGGLLFHGELQSNFL